MTHVLVTGGAGFIGSHVTAALLAAGHEVTRSWTPAIPAAHREPLPETVAGVPVHRADVRDRAAVAGALPGVDAVVHQAAMVGMGVDLDDLPEYVGCNDLGTAVLLAEMARAGVRRLVLASSMVVYGEGAYACAGTARPARRPRASPTWPPAGSSPPARAAARAAGAVAWSTRTPRSTRAACTPPPSSPRST